MHLDLAKSSHSLVLMSGIASIILISCLLIYRYVYPKKTIHPVILVFLISLLPVISIFRPGSYESGDLSFHTMNTISYYHMLFGENILPRWTPEFNVGYGDPFFLFSYLFPYFIGSVFHFIGFGYLLSIKLLLALSFILSGLTMYLWAKDELGEKAGFVSAIFYLFAPYHLVDLHFRVTIAETLSFAFIPLILFLVKKVITTPKIYYIIAGAVSYGLLILSHQIIALSFFPIAILYGLFVWMMKKQKGYKELFKFFVTLCLGLLLTLFYWFPILTEAKYTQASLSKNLSIFTPLPQLLYSPWRFGFLFQGHHGELSYIIGYTQLAVVIMAIYLLFKGELPKKLRLLLLFTLLFFFILFFLMLPIAQPLWRIVPLLNYFQFSYRLLELVALCTATLAGIVVTKWNNKVFIIILCFLTIFYTILNWGNRRNIPEINDAYLINQLHTRPESAMTYMEPSSPIWANLQKSHLRTYPKSHIQILSGSAEIKELSRTSIDHTYIINAKSNVEIKENTLYFLGWTLLVNKQPHAIFYTNPKAPGVITFSLSKGLYEVELKYQDTPDRKYSMIVSIATAIFTMLLLCFSFIKAFQKKKNLPYKKPKKT